LAKFPKFTLVEGSIVDPGAARRAIEGATWVFHLAAIPSVPLSMQEPERTTAVNVGGTVNVLETARNAGVQRVVSLAPARRTATLPSSPSARR